MRVFVPHSSRHQTCLVSSPTSMDTTSSQLLACVDARCCRLFGARCVVAFEHLLGHLVTTAESSMVTSDTSDQTSTGTDGMHMQALSQR